MNNHIILFLASALLAVAGCTAVERLEEEVINDNQTAGHELTIQATREGEPETKTIRNAIDGAVLWVPNDAISLFYGSGTNGGSRFVSNATEATSVTNFTGTITAITGGADISLQDTYFWGVYPYRNDVSCDGSTVTMTLPAQQNAIPGTFDTMLFPSIGRSQGLNMGFYNVCGGWRFSLTKAGIRKVTLKSNNGEIIAGKVKVGLSDSGIPVVNEIIDGSDEVTLECPNGEYFEVGKNYYFVLLPGKMTSGFTMTFETYTEVGVYNRAASTTITRSNFLGITNIDNYLTTPYTPKPDYTPGDDEMVSEYALLGVTGVTFEYARYLSLTEFVTDRNSTYTTGGTSYYIPSRIKVGFEVDDEPVHYISTVNSVKYLTPSSFYPNYAYWSLLKKEGNGAVGTTSGWSPIFKNLSVLEGNQIEIEYAIGYPERMPAFGSSIRLRASIDGKTLDSDWLTLTPVGERIGHLAFRNDNKWLGYNDDGDEACALGMDMMGNVAPKDLYYGAYHALEYNPSVKVLYNGGPIDLNELIAIHTQDIESEDPFDDYTLEEFNNKYPGYHFEFSAVPYTIGDNLIGEEYYGRINGTKFTPCYVKSQGNSSISMLIAMNDGSAEAVSAVGHMPMIIATLVNDDTGAILTGGFFRIEIVSGI